MASISSVACYSYKKVRNMIEYVCLTSKFPTNPTTFTQFSVDYRVCVPDQKPDIERILKVETQVCIDNQKVIKTPVGTSLEGQELTGYKLIVYGRIKQVIMYVANDTEQSVHSAHFENYFCKYIVLPSNFKIYTPVRVIPYIENVNVASYDTRCVNICTTLFLNAILCAKCNTNYIKNCMNLCATPIGIDTTLPTAPVYFKEMILEQDLVIPDVKPDMEGLISISTSVEVICSRIINTEQKTSIEGQNLSGCKLILELQTKDLLVYTADRITQPVHSAHFDGMNSAFVIVPCEINGVDIQTLIEQCKLNATVYVEDICARMVDNRTAKRCAVIFIDISTSCI
ncbi:DUF3794 domain-containing protein [Clostridium sp. B9]|uniref:DUF3794 domain-containing protein n=1 Tax=Clostridium sp. B9 TaxID=3423224 RepID=UPI003D2EA5D1